MGTGGNKVADTVKMSVTLSESAYQKLVELCESSCISKSAMLALAIAEKYDREKGGAQK